MHPIEELCSAFRQWKSLTQGEAFGISTANWEMVKACQEQKEGIRARFLDLDMESLGLPVAPSEARKTLELLIGELIGMEQENARRIEEQLRTTQEALDGLGKQGRVISNVRRCYGGAQDGVWQSYS
jgi:hypothetical protein